MLLPPHAQVLETHTISSADADVARVLDGLTEMLTREDTLSADYFDEPPSPEIIRFLWKLPQRYVPAQPQFTPHGGEQGMAYVGRAVMFMQAELLARFRCELAASGSEASLKSLVDATAFLYRALTGIDQAHDEYGNDVFIPDVVAHLPYITSFIRIANSLAVREAWAPEGWAQLRRVLREAFAIACAREAWTVDLPASTVPATLSHVDWPRHELVTYVIGVGAQNWREQCRVLELEADAAAAAVSEEPPLVFSVAADAARYQHGIINLLRLLEWIEQALRQTGIDGTVAVVDLAWFHISMRSLLTAPANTNTAVAKLIRGWRKRIAAASNGYVSFDY